MRRALASLLLFGCSGPAVPAPPPPLRPQPIDEAQPAQPGQPARTPDPVPVTPGPPSDDALLPPPEPSSPGAFREAPPTQAEIAAALNEEGRQLIVKQQYEQASSKLRQAV